MLRCFPNHFCEGLTQQLFDNQPGSLVKSLGYITHVFRANIWNIHLYFNDGLNLLSSARKLNLTFRSCRSRPPSFPAMPSLRCPVACLTDTRLPLRGSFSSTSPLLHTSPTLPCKSGNIHHWLVISCWSLKENGTTTGVPIMIWSGINNKKHVLTIKIIFEYDPENDTGYVEGLSTLFYNMEVSYLLWMFRYFRFISCNRKITNKSVNGKTIRVTNYKFINIIW